MRPDFVAMANEGIVGVIHEATFPRLERDARYYERQRAAMEAPRGKQNTNHSENVISARAERAFAVRGLFYDTMA